MSNIYTGKVSVIKDEIKSLRERLVRAKNDSERCGYLASIFSLNRLYKDLVGEEFLNFDKITGSDRHLTQRINNFGSRLVDKFPVNFIEEKLLIEEVSSKVYAILNSEATEIDKKRIMVEMYPEKLAMRIIRDFFECYHPEDLELFEELIEQNRMFDVSEFSDFDSRVRGNCYYVYKRLPFLVTYSPFYTVETMSFLIHEFGHAKDMMNLSNNFSFNQIQKYFFTSGKDEVISKLYEKEFIDFCIQAEINLEASSALLYDYYGIIEESVFETYFYTQLPDWLLQKSEYLSYDLEFLKTQLKDPSFKKIMEENESIDVLGIDSSTKYALGGLSAVMLQERFKNSKQTGNKIINTFMNNRTRFSVTELIDTLEYDDCEFKEIVQRDFETIKKYRK